MTESRERESTEETETSWLERSSCFCRTLGRIVSQWLRDGRDIPFGSQVLLVLLALLFLGIVLWTGQAGTDSSHADSIGLESVASPAVLHP